MSSAKEAPTGPRVLLVSNSLAGGGAERLTTTLASDLPAYGFEVDVALLTRRGPLLDELPRCTPVHEMPRGAGRTGGFQRVRRLVDLVDRTRPSAIVSSLETANTLVLRAAGRFAHWPAVVVIEQNNLRRNLGRRAAPVRVLKRLELRRLYRRADRVVAVAEALQLELLDYLSLASERTAVIHNLVDVAKVSRLAEATPELPLDGGRGPLLLSVGRFVPQKAFHELLEALRLIRREVPARLLLLGEGPLRGELERRAEELGLADAVQMPGFVKNPWAFMGRADLFLSSSHWEGFSLVQAEAMACGVPLILTDCEYGPSELVTHGEDGLLVPVGRPDHMANAALELLGDPDRACQLAAAGARRIVGLDRETIVARYAALLVDAIERAARS